MTVGTQKFTASELDFLLVILKGLRGQYQSNTLDYQSFNCVNIGNKLYETIDKIEALKEEIK